MIFSFLSRPTYAVPDVLNKSGLKLSDIDVFEIHEAFAVSFPLRSFLVFTSQSSSRNMAVWRGRPISHGPKQFILGHNSVLLVEHVRKGKDEYLARHICYHI